MTIPVTQKINKAEEKRRKLREQLFPNCEAVLWNRKEVLGFTTIPRTLGLIMTLIEQLAERQKGKDVSRTYFELWCHRGWPTVPVRRLDYDGFPFDRLGFNCIHPRCYAGASLNRDQIQNPHPVANCATMMGHAAKAADRSGPLHI